MDWNVISVQPEEPLCLKVRFQDGTCGTVRFEESHLTGVFSALRSPEIFALARVDHGAVSWPGDIDLASDAMYQAIRQSGEWVLR